MLFLSFAIAAAVVFGLGGIVVGTILLKPDITALTDAVNRINEFASGDSDTAGESVSGSKDTAPVAVVADSGAESETSMDENQGGNENPAQAMTGDEGGVVEQFPAEELVEADSPTSGQDDQPAPGGRTPTGKHQHLA